MSALLTKLSIETDGRYFTAEERQSVLGLAEALPRRVRAAEQVEQHEESALRSALESVQPNYPNFATYHDQAWARQFRDAQLVLRAAVTAMVLDDPRQLDDRALFWMRSMFAANNYTPRFVRDTFTAVRDRLQEKLGGDEFALLQPFLERAVAVLGDFPEPATPAV